VATGVGGAWGEPPTKRLTLDSGELLLDQEHDGERLRALRVYARLSREACLGGVVLRARLDVDGSGRHRVPKNGEFVQAEAPRFLDHPVTAYEWRQIADAARELRHAHAAEAAG
jgi:hypothetical protein